MDLQQAERPPKPRRAGLLELQKHLQADRRVETLVEQVKDEAAETREDGSGEGPRARRL